MGLTPKLTTTVAQVAAPAQTEKGIPFHPLLKIQMSLAFHSKKIHPYNVLKPKQDHFSGETENVKNQENVQLSEKRKLTDVSPRMTDKNFIAPIMNNLKRYFSKKMF